MDTNELLDHLMGDATQGYTDVADFVEQLPVRLADVPNNPQDRLIHGALLAGSQATAGIAGHQAAIRRLFPDTASNAVTAFCVSEDRGPHPRYIKTALAADEQSITGKKMWGTMAPPSTTLYVAASVGQDKSGNNQLVMVAVDNPQPSIKQIPLPPERQAGGLPICDLEFAQTPVARVYKDDAYENYIKPFRLIEDVFSTFATQIALFRLGARTGLDRTAREDLLGLIMQGNSVVTSGMHTPAEILLLTSYLRGSQRHWGELASAWHRSDPALFKHWQPGRMILTVAARARDKRRTNAWSDMEG